MNKDKKSLIFFGNERLATGVSTTTPILNKLINSGYIPNLIVVSNATSKSRQNRDLEILDVAKAHNIPILNTNNNEEILEQINKLNPDFAVLAAYGRIIPQSILDAFPDGIINIHPSLLPKHRGPTPIESILLNGEKVTGVSIIKLVKDMDAGPIYLQKKIDLDEDYSKQELCDKLSDIGADLVVNNLEDIIHGKLTPSEQDDTQATYDKLIDKNDGIIEWSKSAEIIEREIRAYSLWPQSKTSFGDIECSIEKAIVINESGPVGGLFIREKMLGVYCGNQALLIEQLKPSGKNSMSSTAFLAGYRSKLEL